MFSSGSTIHAIASAVATRTAGAAGGIGIPAGQDVVDPAGAVSAARSLGGATVVKALSSGLHHKSEHSAEWKRAKE